MSKYKHDSEFQWRLKRKYVKAQQMQGYVTGVSIGFQAPAFLELASSGIVGLDMQSGDMHHDFFPLPYDLDVYKRIWFRILWSLSGTVAAADDTDWILTYTSVNAGYMTSTAQVSVAGTTALIDSVTALDTTINTADGGVQDYETSTADRVLWTGYGWIAPYRLDNGTVRGLDPLNDCLAIRIEMNAQTGDPTEIHLLGYEMAYSQRALQGPDGMARSAPNTRHYLGNVIVDDSPV